MFSIGQPFCQPYCPHQRNNKEQAQGIVIDIMLFVVVSCKVIEDQDCANQVGGDRRYAITSHVAVPQGLCVKEIVRQAGKEQGLSARTELA